MNHNGYASRESVLRIFHACGLAAVLLLSASGGRASASALLVENGQPRAEIVIAEEPARMARLAASELQTYIEKISGARLPIVTEPSGDAARIYVGISPHTEALGLETEGLKYGAYRMASGPNWLALLGPDMDFEPVSPWRSRDRGEMRHAQEEWDRITGNTFGVSYAVRRDALEAIGVYMEDDTGTFNAVAEYLRDLGVRWYMPGEIGEVVPRMSTIKVPAVDRTVRPDFDLRHVEFWHAFREWTNDDRLWSLRLGLFDGHGLFPQTQPVHGMKFVHGRDEYKERHPDHFAIWDGARAKEHKGYGAPCLSAEGLFENHVAYVRAMIDHYGEPMVSIDPVDGYGRGICECDQCRDRVVPERGRGGRMSDYVWEYVNRVAREVYASHPDRKVSGLSYSTYREPPEHVGQMSPNMVLLINAARFRDPDTRATWRRKRRAWLDVLPSQELYATGHFYTHAAPTSRGLPDYFPRLVADNIRELKRDGVRGERAGVYTHRDRAAFDYNEFAIQHLNFYVTTRLWWDVDQDLDALLEEYYTLFYGPAREEMKAFIEYSEQHVEHMRHDVDRVRRAQELFAAAQQAVEPGTVYADRVQLVADYLLLDQIAEAAQRRREDVPRLRVLGPRDQSQINPWTLRGKTLDGRLDNENEWPPLEMFQVLREVETGGRPENPTWLRAYVMPDAVYFGLRVEEPDMANLNLGDPAKGEEGIREGDFVELLLETASHSYYRITVNPAGVLIDADCSEGVNKAWTSGADAAAHRGAGYWSVEIRVPVAGEDARMLDPLLGIDGRTPTREFPWYFNVVRQRVRDGEIERSAFSPTGEDRFDVPERFAEMWSRYGQ